LVSVIQDFQKSARATTDFRVQTMSRRHFITVFISLLCSWYHCPS